MVTNHTLTLSACLNSIKLVRIQNSNLNFGKYQVTQAQYQAVMGTNPSQFKNKPKNPVENVSFNDAQAFCQKLSQITDKTYRLPTDVEWEYVCQAGGSSTAFCFGDAVTQLEDYAWYGLNSGNSTHPVGKKLPNAWGLFDMHGNVWEWCKNGFYRGGSFRSDFYDCRSAVRYHNNGFNNHGHYFIGFRIVSER